MKVYVVICANYHESYVIGVYKSYESAKKVSDMNIDYYVDESVLED